MDKDLIDRDEVFSKLINLYRYAKGEARIAYRNAIDLVLDMPSATSSGENSAYEEFIKEINDEPLVDIEGMIENG